MTTSRLFFVTLVWSLCMVSRLFAATLVSDGSRADVQAKIDAAADGDVVAFPPGGGTYTWSAGVTISGKAIQLRGTGAGRIVARSASSVAIGTGTKTFTLVTESVASIEALKAALTGGTTVRISEICNAGNYLQGTVTSLVGGTTLTLNITSVGGSGTPDLWLVALPATTTVIHSAGSANLLTTAEATAGSVEITGIAFDYGTGTGNTINHGAVSSGKPILIHDCRFTTPIGAVFIRTSANRGVVYKCSFDASPFREAEAVCIQQKDAGNSDASSSGSWTRAATMGTADTGGVNNLYVEDCDFHGFAEALDADDNGRIVVRDNLFNNSSMGTHGADTSYYGVRHFEVYDNAFVFNDRGTATFNLQSWLYIRGGTGLLTGNVMPDIVSGWWGDKAEVRVQLQNLQRNQGPHPLWGKDIAGVQYPAPRQFGMGYVTGASGSDAYTYNGDAEPFYQWSNTGGGAYASPSIENYQTPGTGEDDVADYVQVGRDYLNATKSGWTSYTYPHPLRGSSGSIATVSGTTTVTGTLTLP